jgi:signal transduction histidine kinase
MNSHDNITLQDSVDYYLQKAYDDEVDEVLFIKFIDKADYFNNLREQDSIYFTNRHKIAYAFSNFNLDQNFIEKTNVTLRIAINLEDTVSIARSYNALGTAYSNLLKGDSAIINYQRALKFYYSLENNNFIGRTYANIATEKFSFRDYIGAEKAASSALTFLRLSKNDELLCQSYNLLGVIYSNLDDLETSDDYLKKALEIANSTVFDSGDYLFLKETTLNNISELKLKQQKYNEVLSYINDALTNIKIVSDYPSLYSSLLHNRASANIELKNYESAILDLDVSLEIKNKYSLNIESVNGYLLYSRYYDKIGNQISAIDYAKRAYEISKETNILNLQVKSLESLSKINDESYLNYSKDFITLNDSLINMERKNSEKFARIEFEADEMRRQNEILNLRNRNIYTLAALIIATLLLVYLVRERRNRIIRLRLLEAQQNANEEVYNLMLTQQQRLEEVIINEKQRIGQDLHDGVLGRLFGARMNLDSMTIDLARPEAVERRNHFIKELQEIEQDIREVSHELSKQKKSIIDNFMLIFTQLLEDQKTAHKTQLEYDVDVNIRWDLVNNNIKINLYRIVQEALQNINKYAEASLIIIIIQKKANNIQAVITDDGVGFEVDKKSKGIGMKNITSRVEACYGSFSITSKKGEGTKIKVVFPLKYFKS